MKTRTNNTLKDETVKIRLLAR